MAALSDLSGVPGTDGTPPACGVPCIDGTPPCANLVDSPTSGRNPAPVSARSAMVEPISLSGSRGSCRVGRNLTPELVGPAMVEPSVSKDSRRSGRNPIGSPRVEPNRESGSVEPLKSNSVGEPMVEPNPRPKSNGGCCSLSWSFPATTVPQRPQKRAPADSVDLQNAHWVILIVALLLEIYHQEDRIDKNHRFLTGIVVLLARTRKRNKNKMLSSLSQRTLFCAIMQ